MKSDNKEIVIGNMVCNFIGEDELNPEKYDISIDKNTGNYYIYNGETWINIGDNINIIVDDIQNISTELSNFIMLLGVKIDPVDNNVVMLSFCKKYTIHECEENGNRYIYLDYMNHYTKIKCNIKIMFNCSKLKDSAFKLTGDDDITIWRLGNN